MSETTSLRRRKADVALSGDPQPMHRSVSERGAAAPERINNVAVTIAVATYRRTDLLPQLIADLEREIQEVRNTWPSISSTLLFVDNDPDRSAQQVIDECGVPFVRYVHEPTPGIAFARNRAMDEAFEDDVLIFIDDDERPESHWLVSLLGIYASEPCGAVTGPVARDFEYEPDPWLVAGGFFPQRRRDTGEVVEVAATNNLLLDLRTVQEERIRFDEKYALVGGGDTHFTLAMTRAGSSIVWCEEAVVRDLVPASRMTRRWALSRSLRLGISTVQVRADLARSRSERLRVQSSYVWSGVGRALVGLGLLTAGSAVRKQQLHAQGARIAARGAGMLWAATGGTYREYGRG